MCVCVCVCVQYMLQYPLTAVLSVDLSMGLLGEILTALNKVYTVLCVKDALCICTVDCLNIDLIHHYVHIHTPILMHLSMLAPTPPLPGEVGQSWGFDLIRIQLPHPPGNV